MRTRVRIKIVKKGCENHALKIWESRFKRNVKVNHLFLILLTINLCFNYFFNQSISFYWM